MSIFASIKARAAASVVPSRPSDPLKAMGQVFADYDAAAGATRYIAPRHQMPVAMMAKTCRDAASAIICAEDPARTRAEFIDLFIRTLDGACCDATESLADRMRRAGG